MSEINDLNRHTYTKYNQKRCETSTYTRGNHKNRPIKKTAAYNQNKLKSDTMAGADSGEQLGNTVLKAHQRDQRGQLESTL